jgi:hypothetical protein
MTLNGPSTFRTAVIQRIAQRDLQAEITESPGPPAQRETAEWSQRALSRFSG